MNQKNSLLLAPLGFIICALIGLGLGKAVSYFINSDPKGSQYNGMPVFTGDGVKKGGTSPSIPIVPSTPTNPSTSQPQTTPTTPASPKNTGPETGFAGKDTKINTTPSTPPANNEIGGQLGILPEILDVSKPIYNETTNKYSFTVHASSDKLTFILADANNKELRSQGSGAFHVSPTSSGVYFVCVQDLTGNRSAFHKITGCIFRVNKITREELESVFNSGDASRAAENDFKNRVSSACKYTFNNCKEEESFQPKSYNEILNRIRMKTWSSISVNSISYNEKGQMTKAVLTVNY